MKYVLKKTIPYRGAFNTLIEVTLSHKNAWCLATNNPMVFDSKSQAKNFALINGHHVASIVPVRKGVRK